MKWLLSCVILPLTTATALAAAGGLTPVPSANPKSPGVAAPNVRSPEILATVLAQGSTPPENPGCSHKGIRALVDRGGLDPPTS